MRCLSNFKEMIMNSDETLPQNDETETAPEAVVVANDTQTDEEIDLLPA
jgi:hypothetical protein